MSPPARRETAKSLKLCYRCLGGDHNGETCVRSRVCGISNCKKTHNRLLHRDSASADRSEQGASHDRPEMEQRESGGSQTTAEGETSNEMSLTPPQDLTEQATERSHSTVTSQNAQPRFVAATKLIVKHYHEKDNHVGGTNQMLAALSTRFSIISGREEIREWEKECN